MKKKTFGRIKMKKVISVFLSLVMLVGCLSVMGAGVVNAADYVAYPTVYINGGRGSLYKADGTKIAPVETPEGFLADAVKDCIGDLAKAVVTGSEADMQAYKEKLVSWIAPLYDDIRLDNNGEPTEPVIVGAGSSGYFTIPDTLPNRISGGEYPLRAYDFYYDWRLDPYETAAELNDYIGKIMAATGRDKVNLVGRCEGGCPLMAYLDAYGHAHVNKIMFYNTASNGYLLPTQLCSGKVEFRSADVRAWLNNNVHFSIDSLEIGEDIVNMLFGMLNLSAATPQIDLVGSALDGVYTRVLREVIPDVFMASYGTFPAVWAMVASADFDDALAYMFKGKEAQYAGLIEKISAYHQNVQLRTEEILKECEADGVQIGAIAKYGYPAIPLSAEAEELSDGEALVKYLSFGATCATYAGTLSDAYIASRDAGYISVDKKIDASTCLFPETTWFIGGVDHQSTPWEMNDICQRFFTSRSPMTVRTDAKYPQFLVGRGDETPVVPLTEDNKDMSVVGLEQEAEAPGAVASFDQFMSGLLTILLRLVERVRAFIEGIVAHANGRA